MKIGLAVLLCLPVFLAGIARAQNAGDGNPGHLRMALVNMKCLYTDGNNAEENQRNMQININRHLNFIDFAVGQGAEFVGFPELSINGYRFSANTEWLRLDGPEVQTIARKAAERKVYVSVGLAEIDADGKKWNTHIVIGPDGRIIGRHNKIWLTAERGHTESGKTHNVFEVKGVKMGMIICADGTDYFNLKALADNGAKIIYSPHANTTGSTIAGWYRFRARWGGKWDGNHAMLKTSNDGPEAQMPSGGWVDQLNVYAALHNHAGLYNPEYNPPVQNDTNNRFASGAWFISPEGETLAQMPTSSNRDDSMEYVLVYNVPIGGNQ